MSTENSELMMHHYLDLDSASDWSCCMGNLRQLINQKHYTDLGSDSHQYGIFALGGGKPVVATRNVGSFLRLPLYYTFLKKCYRTLLC